MTTFASLLVAAVAIVAIYETTIAIRKNARRKAEDKALLEYAVYMENEARAHEIVFTCHRDLERQRAGGYGPWLASLLEGPMYLSYDERGEVRIKTMTRHTTPGIALTAVRMTIRELTGSRFNLGVLFRAETELREMGAGD